MDNSVKKGKKRKNTKKEKKYVILAIDVIDDSGIALKQLLK